VATIGARASARFNVILHCGIEAVQTPRSEETAAEFFNPLKSISSYYVAQAFQPAGSGDFPVASFVPMKHGTRMSRKPADKNVCAT